ncbi:hypothetical protein Tco_1053539 [Tanacetum coccineum]|uniref:Uncharacterized protein n=1 Tax=Tanacetum coccineum TaxID=301880 RepID=A0ABQ5GW25_9ASTR
MLPKYKKKLIEEDISKMVEGDEEESYASEFVDFVFNDDDYFGTRLEPGSHKENPETVDDDDEEEKKDDKNDDNDNDDQYVMAVEGLKKRCLIIEALEEEATVVWQISKKKKPKGVGKYPRVLACYIGNLASGSDSLAPDFEEAHAAHNMIYGLHYPLLKDKLGFLTFDELVYVYDIHALQLAVVGNMLTNESRILSLGHSKLKNNLVSLNSKKSLLEHEMSKLEGQLAKALKNQDVEASQVRVAASYKESRKKLMEVVDGLQSRLKETERLGKRCQDLEHERDFFLEKSKEIFVLTSQLEAAKLEKSKFVKDFLPLADYHPEAEKIFDEAAKAFYKLEFPYISLLVENAGLSPEKLASLEAPLV